MHELRREATADWSSYYEDARWRAQAKGRKVAIFAVQVAIAHAWLRWFRFGPAEWVWRSIVYWRPQPMR